MSEEEIKEILRNCEKAINDASGYNDTTNKILDYITNLQQKVEQLEKENKQLRTQVNTYENPDDLTLFYMWLDEKAKDKIKQLENIRKEAIEYVRNNFQQNIITGSEYLIGYSPCTDLLNILNKGSDK